MAEKPRESRSVKFGIPVEGEPPKDLQLVAYVFDRRGQLLVSAPIEGGEAGLAIAPEQAARARLIIGPALPPHRADTAPTVDLVQRIGGYEPAWRFDPKQPLQRLLAIPERIWKRWLWCQCLVRGQVVRNVSVGGSTLDYPVCKARVHLCEVDRLILILQRLPDDIVRRIRDELLVEFRPPIPIPDPPPFVFNPGVIDATPSVLASTGTSMVRLGLLGRGGAPGAAASVPTMSEFSLASDIRDVTQDVPNWLRTTNLPALRDSLIKNVDLIRPYLCWPWLWPWFRCDEFAVLETNADGRFETLFWYPCFGDKPDIYAWVEFSIGGVWTSVYQPPIACSTRWDYACGDDITIRVSDPRVPVCGEPPESPGKSVTLLAIGENVSVHELQMTVGSSQGLTMAGEPFGGVLEPRVLWGRTALFAANISHYRWSYRRLSLSDGVSAASDPSFHHMARAVVRHYESPPTAPGGGPSYPVEPLGPKFGSEQVFAIQPFAPSAPDAGPDGWQVIDSHEDNATAFFETNLLNVLDPEAVAGRYELKLELFRIVGGVPTLIDLTAENVDLLIPDIDAPFGAATVTTSPPTSEEFYFRRVADNHVVAFRLVVRVDNNICHGNIVDVNIAGVGAGSCGFLEYHHGDSATIAFMASHPHGFATFDFNVYRGSGCPVSEALATGHVDDSSANGFTRSGTTFSKSIPVSTLLSSSIDPLNCPPCDRDAAFAETLWVYATATDGWYRLNAYDAPRGGPSERANKAFAVQPHTGP